MARIVSIVTTQPISKIRPWDGWDYLFHDMRVMLLPNIPDEDEDKEKPKKGTTQPVR